MSRVDFEAYELDILLNVLLLLVAWLPDPNVYTDESLDPELPVSTVILDPEFVDESHVETVPLEKTDCAATEGYELTVLSEARVLYEAPETTV